MSSSRDSTRRVARGKSDLSEKRQRWEEKTAPKKRHYRVISTTRKGAIEKKSDRKEITKNNTGLTGKNTSTLTTTNEREECFRRRWPIN